MVGVAKDKARQNAKRKLNHEQKKANTRAKYGPSMRPSKVTVKTLDGEVLGMVDQSRIVAPPPPRSRTYSQHLDRLARHTGFETYETFLLSKDWALVRSRVIERDNGRCRRCDSERCLQVHHRSYKKGLLNEAVLETLCGRCHRACH